VLALVVTVAVAVPAFILLIGHLFGYDKCPRAGASPSIICSQAGALFLFLLMVVVGFPLSRAWSKFLVGWLGSPATGGESTVEVPDVSRIPSSPISLDLPAWQRLSSGEVGPSGPTNHLIRLNGTELTLWSAFALSTGKLKSGASTVVVYQRTPLRNLNLALAYWDRGESSVHGVAGTIHIVSATIAAACCMAFDLLRLPSAPILMSLSGLLVASSVLYLVLMMRAKAALRDFLRGSDGGPTAS
jgi:hypothetical protein